MLVDITAYIGIILTALFSHINYSVNMRTPKYAILSIFIAVFALYLSIFSIEKKSIKFRITFAHVLWLSFSYVAFLSCINVAINYPAFLRRSVDVAFYILLNVLLSFFITNFMNDKKRIEKYLLIFLITGFVIALNGVLNYYTSYDIFLGVVEGLLYRDRIKSTIGNVIFVANYLNMLIPISFYFIVKGQPDEHTSYGKLPFSLIAEKLFALLNALLYIFILTIAQVRAEFIAWLLQTIILVTLTIWFSLNREEKLMIKIRSYLNYLKIGLLTIALLWFAMVSVLFYLVPSVVNNYGDLGGGGVTLTERLESKTINRDLTIRLLAWISAIKLWQRHKLLGNGINTYQILGSNVISDLANSKPEYNFAWQPFDSVHNDYLQILSETGILGFVIILTLFLYLLIYVIKNLSVLRENNNMDDLILFVCLILSVTSFAVQAFFSPIVQVLPSSLLANFIISTGLGVYFNKVKMKEIELTGKIKTVTCLVILSIALSGAYFRTTHYLSEYYYGRARVANEFLSTFEDQKETTESKLEELENLKKDNKINSSEYEKNKRELHTQLSTITREIRQAYVHGESAFLASIKFDRTNGASMFYFSGFAYHPLRIDKLSRDMEKHYEKILNQDYDRLQKIIDKNEKRTDLTFLLEYIKKHPYLLKSRNFTENLSKAQASLDSLSLFSMALKRYAEPNTYSLISRRYQVLCESLDELRKFTNDDTVKATLLEKKNYYFQELTKNGHRLFYLISGGWFTYPAYKNLDIELSSISNQDMHRNIASFVLMSRVDSFDLLYKTLKSIAEKEIQTCLNLEKQNIPTIPDGVLSYLHALVVKQINNQDKEKAEKLINEILDSYRECYSIACQRLENKKIYKDSYKKLQDVVIKRLKGSLKNKLANNAINELINELEDSGKEAFEKLTNYDFKKYINSYIDLLTKKDISQWPFVGLNSPWKSLMQPHIQKITFSSLSLTNSLDIFGKVGNVLSAILDSKSNQSVFALERYMMFKNHYEIIESLKNKLKK
ncbi:MAG: O-antigen ligase family protein [Fervidobacterium sp.]|nr:O-antigen ligase family protein [Fervidobacterium sp.]